MRSELVNLETVNAKGTAPQVQIDILYAARDPDVVDYTVQMFSDERGQRGPYPEREYRQTSNTTTRGRRNRLAGDRECMNHRSVG